MMMMMMIITFAQHHTSSFRGTEEEISPGGIETGVKEMFLNVS